MEIMPYVSTVVGILVRLALPIAITLLVAYALRRLDQRWQRQGTGGRPGPVSIVRCWVLNDCPEEQRASCAVYQDQNIPCWQFNRDERGRLAPRCLNCQVFRQAPVYEPL